MADRLLFPAPGFTTRDLAEYYERVAPVLLPHLKDRPVSLKRYPDDIDGEAFWEKDAPNFTPKWVRRYAVPRRHEHSVIHYIGLPDAKTLRWTAQMGCIEIHPFLHRYPYIESPTLIAFDLDPGPGKTILGCCEVALDIRAWFEQWQMESFAKFSGSKGMQVYVPLNTPSSYTVTQPLARMVAEELERRNPARITARMAKGERAGKVFIDWSQNSDYKTTVSAYSVRAKRENPYVSAPVTWEEVRAATKRKLVRELFFSPEDVVRRLEAMGDLFAPVAELRQPIPAKMMRELHLPPTSKPVAVRVSEPRAMAPSIPRSSGQGGRKLFVVHRRGSTLEFGIEHNNSLFLFQLARIPLRASQSVEAVAAGTQPLAYITHEDAESGVVWDLGTYEVVEGSLARGGAHIYLSGRRLSGGWGIELVEGGCRITNRGGGVVAGGGGNGSVLMGAAAGEGGGLRRTG